VLFRSLTMEIPSKGVTIECEQVSGSGTISGTNGLEKTITLECELAGFEAQCNYNPITLKFSGTAGKVAPITTSFYLKTSGKTCPWDENWIYSVPSFSVEVGAEGAVVPVGFKATGTFGGNAMYYSGSSSWELSGAYLGKTLGIW